MTTKRIGIESSLAIAEAVRLANVDDIAAYPITPQTHIVEGLAEMVANGHLDAEYIPVESEHSAMSSCLGASAISSLGVGKSVTAYVAKHGWYAFGPIGISVVNVEGQAITPTVIPTNDYVNSCKNLNRSGKRMKSRNTPPTELPSGVSRRSGRTADI